MKPDTKRVEVPGPAGAIVCAIDEPAADGPLRGVVLACHPHPQHGGTLDNKVVQTLARAAVQTGWRCVRFNFRGVGGSAGSWDEGRGEVDDAMAVATALREPGLPLVLGGFSFGGYVASHAARRLAEGGTAAERLILIAPATSRFEVAACSPETVVLHGEADEVVPLDATMAWARPLGVPVTVLPGVGHFFHGQLTLLKTLLARALR